MVVMVVMVVITTLAVGCASTQDSSSASTTTAEEVGRPVTEAEAAVLADILVRNHESGGAAVAAEVPFGVATFAIDGEVDWSGAVGSVLVAPELDSAEAIDDAAADPGASARRIAFSSDTVLEEVPGLAERLAADGRPPANWVARPLDPVTSPLDVVLSLILAASSTARENPVLLIQDGARWLGEETVRTADGDVDVDVFSSGRSRYFVNVDGDLVRQEADVDATASTVTIDFSDRGPRIVAVPAEDDVVAIDEVIDIYGELVNG